jgi:hypothetical protein
MRVLTLLVVCVGGCAHEEPRPTAAACTIQDVKWPAAQENYSKARTAETLDKLSLAVRADREAFRADPTGHNLGTSLLSLNAEMQSGPFVADNAHQAAIRLRQLDCAVQRGVFNGRATDAEHLYTDILNDVDNQLKLAKQ